MMMDRLAGVLPIRWEGGTWAAYSYGASTNEDRGRELASQEQAALIAWQLACGETLNWHVIAIGGARTLRFFSLDLSHKVRKGHRPGQRNMLI
jgi:hypothetical protein